MAEKPLINPTPRQEFQSNQSWVSMHRDMMQQPMLQVSLQFAINEYTRRAADQHVVDGNTAAQNFYKLQGMHDFINILKNLAEMAPAPLPKPKIPQLTQV
jgi:hypothetical protein